MIQLYNVCMSYQKDASALTDFSLKVPKGDFLYLTGSSGAGKSTLLKLLYGAEKPSRGQILVNGMNITRMRSWRIPLLRRKIGIVFQDFKLISTRTLFENVAFPLEVQGKKRYEISNKVYQALKHVGLQGKLNRLPLQLSGGEQQRAAIARALVTDPLILLADEPTGNLDDDVANDIMELFKGANARGTTVVFATHDREMIRRFPRRIVVLDKGRLVEDHTP
ncbi:cell division ATP-binding protein FtsE [Syntrophotalea acetylenica]|uniref:Cell division ATP-binding protein FtsE n=1 Tax=Syntrophotalea acetylenica TaxID=29542 RepID=A0A1L3GIM8_SYNAC|nr:cell division ATP-binding protein FtsE [Syntrophotalea acetylenica]APG25781.1 cell division ATP-binding protein FtsE [Syntrophotalea acetylenica]APG43854.1 cell division ATP-binding protein FtsE [Syntrophotalea acetylenica]MDY0262285.1 cell division ATP-binding protein FtsE [Syntrophotalea acetylenica]